MTDLIIKIILVFIAFICGYILGLLDSTLKRNNMTIDKCPKENTDVMIEEARKEMKRNSEKLNKINLYELDN